MTVRFESWLIWKVRVRPSFAAPVLGERGGAFLADVDVSTAGASAPPAG
jgi:hypothetical protein